MVVLTLLSAMFATVATPVSVDGPAPDKQTAKYEIRFTENMIDRHAMAVMMAEMCNMKAVHPEMIAACENIIVAQSHEIKMMQTWLCEWYRVCNYRKNL